MHQWRLQEPSLAAQYQDIEPDAASAEMLIASVPRSLQPSHDPQLAPPLSSQGQSPNQLAIACAAALPDLDEGLQPTDSDLALDPPQAQQPDSNERSGPMYEETAGAVHAYIFGIHF